MSAASPTVTEVKNQPTYSELSSYPTDTNDNVSSLARLDNVSFSYDNGQSWALHNISLSIRAGEHVCILGSNGSGKSTMAHILDGSMSPDSGRVELMGKTVYNSSDDQNRRINPAAYRAARRNIGLVFQNPEDQIVTTVVQDDVAFGPENLGKPRPTILEDVKDSLEKVGLSHQANDDPTRMSGGQQQRLALAGNLSMHPAMMILDEPGAMLDSAGRRNMINLMGELTKTGTTVVHITHFLESAEHADRVIVLDNGQIITQGSPREVLGNGKLSHVNLHTTPAEAHSSSDTPLSTANRYQSPLLQQNHNEHRETNKQEQALVLEKLSYHFPDSNHDVLNDINIKIDAGQIVAVMGRNGSGKSTLSRIIATLLKPTSGNLVVSGLPVYNHRTVRSTIRRKQNLHLLRQRIGYVMQYPEHQLFADTVALDVAYGPTNMNLNRQQIDQRVTEALQLLNISDLADRSPFDLSGGQKRLVAIAGVLACKPELLILDEVTANLDQRTADSILSMLQVLHQQGVTIIMNTHSDQEVLQLADKVLLLERGRVFAFGAAEEVLDKYHQLLAQETFHTTGDSNAQTHINGKNTEALKSTKPVGNKHNIFKRTLPAHLLQDLDPRSKIITCLLAMVTVFFISKPTQLFLSLTVIIALLTIAQTPIHRIIKSTKVFTVLIAFSAILNMLITNTGRTILNLGWFSVTDEGLWVAVLYSSRLMMVILLGALVIEMTTPTQMTDAFESLLRPLQTVGVHTNEIALVMSLALRFIPTLNREIRSIMEAQSARGGSIETGSPIQRMKASAAIAIPVFAGVLRHANNLSLALDARCYEGGAHRTHYRILAFTIRDYIFIGLMLAYITLLIALAFI